MAGEEMARWLVGWWKQVAFLLVSFALLALFGLVAIYGMPNVVACLEEDTDTWTPAMGLEVTSNRGGHIVERHAFGCTWYWYEGRW